MLMRRYGTVVSAVAPVFEAAAFNEIAFQRQPGSSLEWAEFEERYARVGEHLLTSEAEGHVAIEVEAATLDLLAHKLMVAEQACGPNELLLVESHPGPGYPRLHEHTETLVEEGRNRLHFYYDVDPPLRLGVYRARTADGS